MVVCLLVCTVYCSVFYNPSGRRSSGGQPSPAKLPPQKSVESQFVFELVLFLPLCLLFTNTTPVSDFRDQMFHGHTVRTYKGTLQTPKGSVPHVGCHLSTSIIEIRSLKGLLGLNSLYAQKHYMGRVAIRHCGAVTFSAPCSEGLQLFVVEEGLFHGLAHG
jgi:hypothetical protein